MEEIKWSLEEKDIEWTMDWKRYKGQNDKRMDDKPDEEQIFEVEGALAHMIINEVIFLNSHHWEKEWPEKARSSIAVLVNCNDVFAWGCSDAEKLPYSEIENLYKMWRKDPEWGAAVWCMKQRNQMPQKPVENRIRNAGIWNLDELNLGENTLDAEIHAQIAEAARSSKQ